MLVPYQTDSINSPARSTALSEPESTSKSIPTGEASLYPGIKTHVF